MHNFKLLVTTNAKKMKALKTKELQKLSGGICGSYPGNGYPQSNMCFPAPCWVGTALGLVGMAPPTDFVCIA